jgi:glutaminase
MKTSPKFNDLSPILAHLQQLHGELSQLNDGEVANYIPELAKANPDWFGICIVTANGGVYEVGDSQQTFTIQSISKPFVYGLALEDHGRAEVHAKIGVEPTGDAFNAISLEPGTGRPRNPMINAGAIASTGLVEGMTPDIRLQRILSMFGLYAGREVEVDARVYASESETGHRNRAIGHMLRNFGILGTEPTPIVDTYFQQCSILANCRDLAMMAATLANRGLNPLTGKQAIRGEYVESVLGVMGTCGMYDYAGEWLHDVGLPAKSGVAGGIIAVLPGQLGIGVFSPRLDSHGNSVRGIRVCEALSQHWDLHLFNRPGLGKSAIRLRSTAAEFNSNRVRTQKQSLALGDLGAGIHLCQLQGNLHFAATEYVVRELLADADKTESVILDFKRALTISESACRLFCALISQFAEAGKRVVFTHLETVPALRRYMHARLAERFDELFHAFADNDSALEWAENRLLTRACPDECTGTIQGPGDYELLGGLDEAEIAVVAARFQRRTYEAGEIIINAGEDADVLYLLASGQLSVSVELASGRQRRIATFSSGMAFGEMAILDRSPRSATITADTRVDCDLLPLAAIESLGETHPQIRIKILQNLARSLSRKLRKANRELIVLE